MKKKLSFFSLVLALLIANSSYSQYYYYNNRYYDKDVLFELGVGVGGMDCLSDIGGAKSKKSMYINEINWKNTQVSGGVYAGVMYQQTVGVRLEATWGAVKAYDSIIPKSNNSGRYERNLNFKSTISEIALLAEFHPLMLGFFAEEPPRLSPYILAGVGWFSFRPTANVNGRIVDLKPLHTEGEGFAEYKDRPQYHLSQANIPIGGGLKYELSELFNVRLEFIHRILFTDYLDDVSTSFIDRSLFSKYLTPAQATLANSVYDLTKYPVSDGNQRGSKFKDSYLTFNLKIGLTLGRERRK